METASQIAIDALIDIGIGDAFNLPDPEYVKVAMRYLNRFMAMNEATGMTVGFTPVANPTDYLTVPSWALQWIQKELAVLMASPFKKSITSELEDALSKSRSIVLSHTVRLGKPSMRDDVPVGSGNYDHFGSTYFSTGNQSGRMILSGNTSPTTLSVSPMAVVGAWQDVYSNGVRVTADGVMTMEEANVFSVECSVLVSSTVNQNANLYIAYQPSGGTMSALTKTAEPIRLAASNSLQFSLTKEITLNKGDAIQLWADGIGDATFISAGVMLSANSAHR